MVNIHGDPQYLNRRKAGCNMTAVPASCGGFFLDAGAATCHAKQAPVSLQVGAMPASSPSRPSRLSGASLPFAWQPRYARSSRSPGNNTSTIAIAPWHTWTPTAAGTTRSATAYRAASRRLGRYACLCAAWNRRLGILRLHRGVLAMDSLPFRVVAPTWHHHLLASKHTPHEREQATTRSTALLPFRTRYEHLVAAYRSLGIFAWCGRQRLLPDVGPYLHHV